MVALESASQGCIEVTHAELQAVNKRNHADVDGVSHSAVLAVSERLKRHKLECSVVGQKSVAEENSDSNKSVAYKSVRGKMVFDMIENVWKIEALLQIPLFSVHRMEEKVLERSVCHSIEAATTGKCTLYR